LFSFAAPTIPESVEVKIAPGSSMFNFTWSLGSGRRDGFETVLFTPEGNITGDSRDTPCQ